MRRDTRGLFLNIHYTQHASPWNDVNKSHSPELWQSYEHIWRSSCNYICMVPEEIQHNLRYLTCRLCSSVENWSIAMLLTQYQPGRSSPPRFGTTHISPHNHAAATVLGRHSTKSLSLHASHCHIWGLSLLSLQANKLATHFVVPLRYPVSYTHLTLPTNREV